ncbi:hypothetical protein Holit_01696 [Hollandina sp. SP2]
MAIQISGKLRYGMVDGGPGTFIGDVHQKSIALDGRLNWSPGVLPVSRRKPWKQVRP